MTWDILIAEPERDKYKKKLDEIVACAIDNKDKLESKNIGLMGGKIGLALLLFYYARLTREEQYYDLAIKTVEEVFDEINRDFVYHTFAGGLAGIGWVVEHLVKNEFIEADSNEILEDIDPFLRKMMVADIKSGNYDYLHGACGVGLYFLSRLPNPLAKEALVELIDELDQISHKEEDGALKWKSILNREEGTQGYNLSLSHGISSIIAFLGKAYALDINRDKTASLLKGAVQFLFKNEMDTTQFLSRFPSWISDTPEPPTNSRLAWCYGDLGVGISLWQVGRDFNNPQWQKEAIDTLLFSTKRRDAKESMIIDAGLCHGAAGLAHLYNRAFQHTGVPAFKDTALYWANYTLAMASHPDGMAGYKAWHTEKYGGWVGETAFLEGIAGIGLAIISLISDIESVWDGALLMS